MGRVIQTQEDGRFAVWSTVIDDYVAVDCNAEQAIEISVELSVEGLYSRARQHLERGVKSADEARLKELRNGTEPT